MTRPYWINPRYRYFTGLKILFGEGIDAIYKYYHSLKEGTK